MPYGLSDDERLIQQTVRQLAESIGLDAAADNDRHDRFPSEAIAQAAGLGLLGVAAPSDQGGAGATAYALTVLEMAKVDPNAAAALCTHAMALRAAVAAGQETLVARLAQEGLAAWLATEEAHGSDKRQFGTTARPDGDGWRVDGQKAWVVAASDANHFLVTAQAEEGPTLLRIDRGTPGVGIGRNEPLLGMRAAGIRTVYLSDVQVAKHDVIGAPGGALALHEAARPWLQLGVAAAILGCMEGARRAAEDFAGTRVQFQKPIGSFQAVSEGVVAMDVQAAAGEALLLAAAGKVDEGGPAGSDAAALWAARAKAFMQHAAIPLTRQAIRVQGGTGFMREGGTERFARDVRALQFMGEPFAIQHDTIKRARLDIEFPVGP